MGYSRTRTRLTRFCALFLCGGVLFCARLAAAQDVGPCDEGRLDLRWPEGGGARGGAAHFAVEIAQTESERNRGLMFRSHMPQAAGMLFVFPAPQNVNFWMKNTLIPLDLLFADSHGVVTRIHSNAVPGDLTPIEGGGDVQFVLEINGGHAAHLGIKPGAQIRHPKITHAKWPCDTQ